jgi:hypothetical protein
VPLDSFPHAESRGLLTIFQAVIQTCSLQTLKSCSSPTVSKSRFQLPKKTHRLEKELKTDKTWIYKLVWKNWRSNKPNRLLKNSATYYHFTILFENWQHQLFVCRKRTIIPICQKTITFDVVGPRPETTSCSIHRVAGGKETSNRCGYHIQSLVTKNYPVFKASFHNMKLEQTQGHELE